MTLADPEAVAPAPVPAWDALGVRLVDIVTSPGHSYWGKAGEGRMMHGALHPAEATLVADMGIVGDRYFGEKPGGKAQVTFLQADVVAAVREQFRLKKLPASAFRRNLVVEGVNLGDYLGREFTFQGITFEGTQECKPCQWMDRAVAPGVQAFLREAFRGGLRAKVKSDGVLRVDA